MIDPIHSLAFSVQANRGVYALLLGSGVSRSSEIPTGWEIVLDLVRKLAAATGQPEPANPERWYQEQYNEEPDYSTLLAELAKTPSERQQLLRPYFEPNDEEREQGLKQPTTAHRVIAKLVSEGFIKVIITTNFDHLTERALADEGIEPKVLSSPDQVAGSLPLMHTRCCALKLHGDYLDTRIRNSVAELREYSEDFNGLLDQIFDEFGLIVCGWSADWDEGLRNAMFRASSRRFTTYWATKGELGEHAQRLITHREAQVISIDDADTFFRSIHDAVVSIDQFSRPHPLSVEASVASMKRYLFKPEYRVELLDLIDAVVERTENAISEENFSMSDPQPDKETITNRVRSYESGCSILLSMASVGGFWANEDNSYGWERAVDRISTTESGGGKVLWLALRTYPGRLLLYALGLGAVESNQTNQLGLLGRIFSKTVGDSDVGSQSTNILRALLMSRHAINWQQYLTGMESRRMPMNDWLHGSLRQPLKQIIPNDDKYSRTFDKFEILLALGFSYNNSAVYGNHFPLGRFVFRESILEGILAEFEQSLNALGNDSPYVASNIFGESARACLDMLGKFKQYVQQNGPLTLFRPL